MSRSGDVRRSRLLFGTLCAVFASCLFSLRYACGVESTADDVVSYAGQISDPAAADKNGTVFLKVMTFARNINRTFLLVGQTNSCDFTECGVRLFGRSGRNRKADAAFLRAVTHDGSLTLTRGTASLSGGEAQRIRFLPPYSIRNILKTDPKPLKEVMFATAFYARFTSRRHKNGIKTQIS